METANSLTVSAEGLLLAAKNELEWAYIKHGKERWGRHEFYAILLEEVEELWEVIKHDDDSYDLYEEMVQIVAMCLRYADTGNRYGPSL